jgi:hypothetical protein
MRKLEAASRAFEFDACRLENLLDHAKRCGLLVYERGRRKLLPLSGNAVSVTCTRVVHQNVGVNSFD